MIPKPPTLSDLLCDYTLIAGLGESTVLASIDFETYSEAGFVWNKFKWRYEPLPGASEKGLSATGIAVYATHPSTDVLCLAYDLKDGQGVRVWTPQLDQPRDLFIYIAYGGLIQAWNVAFESWIWNRVCVARYGWPPLPRLQLRCAAAKARAFALPGSLAKAGAALHTHIQKDKMGEHLIKTLCVPQVPTKKNNNQTRLPVNNDLIKYCIQDVNTETEISSVIPDLSASELQVWLLDQKINARGVGIDIESVDALIAALNTLYFEYSQELFLLTNGEICSPAEVARLIKWLATQGVATDNMTVDSVGELLQQTLPENARRVLEIRQMLGMASVKKLYAMKNKSVNGRIYDLFVYHAARTGRAAGAGVQPQNLPRGKIKLSEDDIEKTLSDFKTITLAELKVKYGNQIISVISSLLRSLFIAAPNHRLMASDFSAIEAVVLAELAGETWRQEVFRTHGKIYEISAATITGVSLDEIINHKEQTGNHHPLRALGKVSELASGYQGGAGAWKRFGAEEFLSAVQIDSAVQAWRKASPQITALWYSLERCAKLAIQNPGQCYSYRSISYLVHRGILYCTLPSGRNLVYHNARLDSSAGWEQIVFDGYNSDPTKGRIGWTTMQTYGGKLTENVVQAVARDILMHSALNLEAAGYPIVLHVHDELVAELHDELASIETFEEIMSLMPPWAHDWPIKAIGGWEGKRYRK